MDNIDKKLVSYLYHNLRPSINQIAKDLKINKNTANYHLKKLIDEGIIKSFPTIYNYSALGYEFFSLVFIKTSSNLKTFLRGNKNVISFGEMIDNYNLRINLITKTKQEIQDFIDELHEKFKIEDSSIFLLNESLMFPLKFIEDGTQEQEDYNIHQNIEKLNLNEKDKSLLKALAENGRKRIIDLAEETKLSAELIVHKLKQFKKQKIILGTKILFDMEKLGVHYGVLFLNLNNLHDKKPLVEFCKKNKLVESVLFGFGEYNCLIQFFYSSEDEIRGSLKETLEFTKPNNFKFIQTSEDKYLNTLPFF